MILCVWQRKRMRHSGNSCRKNYDVKFQEYPMVRVTNVDNSEKLDDARAVIDAAGTAYRHLGDDV